MLLKLFRRGKVRYAIVIAILCTACLLIYSGTSGTPTDENRRSSSELSTVAKVTSPRLKSILWPWSRSSKWSKQCLPVHSKSDIDIKTSSVFQTLNFKPQNRVYWNYTFEKRYLAGRKKWSQLPLKVIVLPHSHNDPGWLKTFDNYFLTFTAYILNNMVQKLTKHNDMYFIWAEISFFAKWWQSLKTRPHLRDDVKAIIKRGQLEMVTGGWVMTDEAVAHYYAMIDQLVEGHQWLKTTLGVTPSNGWSIDPFGHSSTVPYLLKASGIKNMIIQRTHYAWKQYLAERQQLEFSWDQLFDGDTPAETLELLCHMAPFDLYSIKHTCGPDQEVCLQFDFRRIAGEYTESRAVQITDENIQEKATLLLGQYGRVASLFPHNVALVFLGDDFRFNHDIEWDQQYQNYQKLFGFINSHKELYAEVSFGTLEDYFKEVRYRMKKLKIESPKLAGDFFPYGDIYADSRPSYWTGYFTTRPYWKRLCRELEHWLRTAEILFSAARTAVRQQGKKQMLERLNQDYEYLTMARDNLGLFQHHDAITGTSKEAVMHDYGMRLVRGIRDSMGIISHSAQFLLLKQQLVTPADMRPAHPMTSYMFPDTAYTSFDTLPQKLALTIPTVEGRKIVLFNSLLHRRQHAIRVGIRSPYVKVLDATNQEIPSQINPAWNSSIDILSNIFELVFIADLPPLTLTTFNLIHVAPTDQTTFVRPSVSVFVNDAVAELPTDSIFSFQNPTDQDIELTSPYLTAVFSKQTGLLQSMQLTERAMKRRINMNFQAYKSEDFRSGAYLFQPNLADPIKNVSGRFPVIRVVRGPVMSEVTVTYQNILGITTRVYHTDGPLGTALETIASFDLVQMQEVNTELFMKLETDIDNQQAFYTDANGFQIMERLTNPLLPYEGNYYPITSSIYIEDGQSRITVLTSHAHGAASLRTGSMEIMLDRRLRYDDSRGLGEGVMDNKKTTAHFWLMLEARSGEMSKDAIPNLSRQGHLLSENLNYPAAVLVVESSADRPMNPTFHFLEGSFPCDYHLINLRTLPDSENFEKPSDTSLMILHRKGFTCEIEPVANHSPCSSNSTVTFKNLKIHEIHNVSLTGLHVHNKIENFEEMRIKPMNLQSYTIKFAN